MVDSTGGLPCEARERATADGQCALVPDATAERTDKSAAGDGEVLNRCSHAGGHMEDPFEGDRVCKDRAADGQLCGPGASNGQVLVNKERVALRIREVKDDCGRQREGEGDGVAGRGIDD